MAATGSTGLTLVDLASRMENGSVAKKIVELLAQKNEMLEDMPWIECNNGTTHKTTVRTGIPAGTWRLLNYGVQPEKSTTAQVLDACGMLETYAKTDKALVDMARDKAAFRFSEEAPFVEGLNQTLAAAVAYGNTTTNPEKIMGFAPRFNSLSAENADNIIAGGGAGSDNTSIWLVVWGPNTVHGIYPQGSQAGLVQRDLGEDTATDSAGREYQIYRTHYKWDCGLTVRDWRAIVRICNIDRSALTKDASGGADLVDLCVQALEVVDDLKMGTPVFYGNRSVRSYLRRQLTNRPNAHLSYDEAFGKRVLAIDGVPFKRMDQILNTEATVS